MTEVVAAEARLAYRGSQSVITCAPGGVVTLSEDTAAWVLTATPKPFTASSAVRFWLAVLTAGFSCYGTLPWTAAWPPRLFSARAHGGLAAINPYVGTEPLISV